MKTRSTQTFLSNTLLVLAVTVGLWAVGINQVKAAPTATTPPVVVTLTVEKQSASAEKDGQPTWEPLGGAVFPGSILRYTVIGRSHLTRPLKKFALTQPIPHGTEYVLSSASATPDAQVTISIDGGKTYAEKPTLKVTHPDGTITDEPAPASRYTHIRWTFLTDLPASGSASAQCEVRVR